MQKLDGRFVHSASDLNAFSECLHLVGLEREVAEQRLAHPPREDETAKLLAQKGEAHEQAHLATLRARFGAALVSFEERPLATRAGYEAAERESVAAMASGAPIIYQPTFFDGTFLGRADFLRRVETPSARWPWSYEVVDTKLALSPKPYFLVQLCNYSEHVERIAGSAPRAASIVLGSGFEQTFELADFSAYYRRLKATYLENFDRDDVAYPFECAHCDLCVWRERCAARRDRDDHLSLVAGMRRDQLAKLEANGIGTLTELAVASDGARPRRMSVETFANLRAQAVEQHRYRAARSAGVSATHSYAFRPANAPAGVAGPVPITNVGFARLPEPDAGDVFFDMEGDPLYRPDRALEYLFGVYLAAEDAYHPYWGVTPADERRAFEAFVDFVVARRERYPNLHVYHYAPYEMSALKRLAGRYASREHEIDTFLRAGTFVDLYPVVRQSVWISQPSYSIKKLEALYGFARRAATQTKAGDDSIVMFESWLDDGNPATLEDIRAYNEDDCRSTFHLREWLRALREERNAELDVPIPWRASIVAPEDEKADSRGDLERALLAGIEPPDTLGEFRRWPEERRARWLFGNLTAYFKRDQKSAWWEYFFRRDNPTELLDDRKSLAGLSLCADVAPQKRGKGDRTLVYEFSFPEQEHEIAAGSKCADPDSGAKIDVVAVDEAKRRIRLKLPAKVAPEMLRALIASGPVSMQNKTEAMRGIASAYADGTLERAHPATLDVVLRRHPRLTDRAPGARVQPERVDARTLSAVVAALDASYLVVQGPPGSGKSTSGAQVIVDLLAAGKRVALAASSHKALHGLAHKVEATARERGFRFRGCHRSSDTNVGSSYRSHEDDPAIADTANNGIFADCTLVSATTYEWAKAEHVASFDYVFIDEAGQISLADALVTSLVASNVVLLGDPQQLPQVSPGSHPPGTDTSILEHLLEEHATIAEDRGVFLDTTYRMHPEIDRFVSDRFYDGRLGADARNARNAIVVDGRSSAGLRLCVLEHAGNVQRSLEEADAIVAAVVDLFARGSVVHREEPQRRLERRDVLIVTPYNAQRTAIVERLRAVGLDDVAVGTVDKFQGQEAPVVFFSLAASSAELAPRGLDFLLSPNRLNVAISRAQARAILVCSAGLLASRATSVQAMRLLNLLCTYAEYGASDRPPAVALVPAGRAP